jgi:hypothetical protein
VTWTEALARLLKAGGIVTPAMQVPADGKEISTLTLAGGRARALLLTTFNPDELLELAALCEKLRGELTQLAEAAAAPIS